MQEKFNLQLRKAISSERLQPYRQHETDPDAETYARYAWNIALCESLYPALNGIEIALRNGVHIAASNEFEDKYWFCHHLKPKEKRFIKETSKRLQGQKKHAVPGDFVAGLSFGFWVSLFNGSYHRGPWPRLLGSVFPFMPRQVRTPKNLLKRLERIRRLRNRVFHHEPVWHWGDLEDQHERLLETISWISPAKVRLVTMLDRFSDVYDAGPREIDGP